MKIMSLNSISIFIKMAVGFISIKVIAYFIPPSGMAMLGNFKNFTAIFQRFSSLGFQQGIVKYISENKKNKAELNKIISTAFISSLSVSILLCITILFFTKDISQLLFNKFVHLNAIRCFGILLPLIGIHVIFISILHGLKEFKDYVVVSILSSILGLVLSVLLIWIYNIEGAIFSLAITESLIVVISFIYIVSKQKITISVKTSYFSNDYFKKLLSFSSMALLTILLAQFSSLFIRNHIIKTTGSDFAGYWETMIRISSYYLLFISSGVALYYLPRLTELKNNWSFKKEIISFYKTLVVFCLLLFGVIYLLRKWIVLILLNDAYLPTTELFLLQLIGDFIKICSLAFSYQFMAKKMTKEYFITEIIYYLTYYTSSIYFINLFGIQGVLMAYVLSYVLYYMVILYIFRKVILAKKPNLSEL